MSASDIAARVSKTTNPDMKNSRVVPMRPEKGYISLVRRRLCFWFLRLFLFLPALILIAAHFAGDGDRQGLPAPCP